MFFSLILYYMIYCIFAYIITILLMSSMHVFVACRTKLKQTEVDCELLKRCCETLTEENRRLHRELQQLRALSHPHPAAFFMPAAAALSICPSCERLATGVSAATATTTTGADGRKAGGPGRAPHLFSPFTKSAAC